MSIWKALLLHGGYVAASPLALRLVAPELFARTSSPAAQPAPAPAEVTPRPPWARVAGDYQIMR